MMLTLEPVMIYTLDEVSEQCEWLVEVDPDLPREACPSWAKWHGQVDEYNEDDGDEPADALVHREWKVCTAHLAVAVEDLVEP